MNNKVKYVYGRDLCEPDYKIILVGVIWIYMVYKKKYLVIMKKYP